MAQLPEILELNPKGSTGDMGIQYVRVLVPIEVPKLGTIYLVPQIVDSSSGVWKEPKIVEPFAAAAGETMESTATYAWEEEGAVAKITLKTVSSSKEIKVQLRWELEGDGTGHMRVDLLLPYEIAQKIRIEGAGGKQIFPDPQGINRGTLPAVFIEEATGERLLNLEGEQNISAVPEVEFEDKGLGVRITPFPPGSTQRISDFSEIEFSLVLP